MRVRVITDGGFSPTPREFILLPVNLDEWKDSVFVSSLAKPWFKDVVVDDLKKYGLGKEVGLSGRMMGCERVDD